MMQPTPFGFRSFEPVALPVGSEPDGATGPTPFSVFARTPASANRPDGIVQPWFKPAAMPGDITPGGGWGGGLLDSAGGGVFGLIVGLIGVVQQLVGAMLGGLQPGGPKFGGAQQRFENVDLSSTGDPHLAVVGTRADAGGATSQVDRHFDSMTSHDDLVHACGIGGGYRVSTTVTQPTANGVTTNQSATVHAGFGADAVTLARDGSLRIVDGGSALPLAKGQSATLSGGETVSANADGSVVVSASDGNGGTIATTLRATGGGVDVTTHAHDLAVGGDIVDHDAPLPTAARA